MKEFRFSPVAMINLVLSWRPLRIWQMLSISLPEKILQTTFCLQSQVISEPSHIHSMDFFRVLSLPTKNPCSRVKGVTYYLSFIAAATTWKMWDEREWSTGQVQRRFVSCNSQVKPDWGWEEAGPTQSSFEVLAQARLLGMSVFSFWTRTTLLQTALPFSQCQVWGLTKAIKQGLWVCLCSAFYCPQS